MKSLNLCFKSEMTSAKLDRSDLISFKDERLASVLTFTTSVVPLGGSLRSTINFKA